MEVAPVFRQALERNRDAFNQLFIRARHGARRLDGEVFAANLRTLLEPVAIAVGTEAGEEAALQVVEGLYPMLLDLTARDHLSPKTPGAAIYLVWKELLPRMPALLAVRPRFLAARLSNAALSVAMTTGASPAFWLKRLVLAGKVAGDVDELMTMAQVAAWRSGLAQYRQSALKLCSRLTADQLRLVLDLPEGADSHSREDLLAGLAHPWRIPGEQGSRNLRLMARVGGFRGFGGPFLRPPKVRRLGQDILVEDGFERRMLFADRFGAVLVRHSRMTDPLVAPPDSGPPGAYGLGRNGSVNLGQETVRMPELANASSFASTTHTLAVALPVSHHLHIVARCTEGSL